MQRKLNVHNWPYADFSTAQGPKARPLSLFGSLGAGSRVGVFGKSNQQHFADYHLETAIFPAYLRRRVRVSSGCGVCHVS